MKNMKEGVEEKKQSVLEMGKRLAEAYPDTRTPLVHRNPYELLMATILSAQSTDDQVNRTTPALFRRYPAPDKLARARLGDIEKYIRSLGLFRSKARSLKESARQLTREFGGKVPPTMEELTRLKGVGRKTANVVLGHAFGIAGVVVDTHAKRLAGRLGLSEQKDPDKIERDLMELLPREEWSRFSQRLILHGRRVCHARKPQCPRCILSDLCPSAELSRV
jgi:endonuclease-3